MRPVLDNKICTSTLLRKKYLGLFQLINLNFCRRKPKCCVSIFIYLFTIIV